MSPAVTSPSKREFSQLIRLGFWITLLSIMTVGNIFTNIICFFQWPNSKDDCQRQREVDLKPPETPVWWTDYSYDPTLPWLPAAIPPTWLWVWPGTLLGSVRQQQMWQERSESLEKHLYGWPCSLVALGTLQRVSKARLACWMRKWYMTQLFEVVGVIIFQV